MASLRATSSVVTDTEHHRIFSPAGGSRRNHSCAGRDGRFRAGGGTGVEERVHPANGSALEAAQEAVRTCAATGYDDTTTVVDVSGTRQFVLRGDSATIHSKDSACREAHTIVTVEPIFQVTTTS